MAASARQSSEVSAMVTQGWSETHRTPQSWMTNFLQWASIRRFAASPVTAPARTG